MSGANHEAKAEEEQGWGSSDKHVCSCCVNDSALAAALSRAEIAGRVCDFCGGAAAAPLDVLLERFVAGLENEYGGPDDEGVPWDGREGGYQVARVVGTWDLMTYEFCDVLTGDGLVEAVRDTMLERNWVERNWVWRRRDEVLTDAWDAFCELVKREPWDVAHQEQHDREDVRFTAEVSAEAILDEVGVLLSRLPGRVHRLAAGSMFWRARVHEESEMEKCRSVKELGTAPPKDAAANRMSPAGVPLFYGAQLADTAVRETTHGGSSGFVTYGRFETTRSCIVVDLMQLPAVSMFDPVLGGDWRYFRFLNQFTETLSRPVEQKVEHADYVPTQMVTTYLLKSFRDHHGHMIDGLMYNSSITGGQCVVLDVPNDACVSKRAPLSENRLQLLLDEDSLVPRRVSDV